MKWIQEAVVRRERVNNASAYESGRGTFQTAERAFCVITMHWRVILVCPPKVGLTGFLTCTSAQFQLRRNLPRMPSQPKG